MFQAAQPFSFIFDDGRSASNQDGKYSIRIRIRDIPDVLHLMGIAISSESHEKCCQSMRVFLPSHDSNTVTFHVYIVFMNFVLSIVGAPRPLLVPQGSNVP